MKVWAGTLWVGGDTVAGARETEAAAGGEAGRDICGVKVGAGVLRVGRDSIDGVRAVKGVAGGEAGRAGAGVKDGAGALRTMAGGGVGVLRGAVTVGVLGRVGIGVGELGTVHDRDGVLRAGESPERSADGGGMVRAEVDPDDVVTGGVRGVVAECGRGSRCEGTASDRTAWFREEAGGITGVAGRDSFRPEKVAAGRGTSRLTVLPLLAGTFRRGRSPGGELSGGAGLGSGFRLGAALFGAGSVRELEECVKDASGRGVPIGEGVERLDPAGAELRTDGGFRSGSTDGAPEAATGARLPSWNPVRKDPPSRGVLRRAGAPGPRLVPVDAGNSGRKTASVR